MPNENEELEEEKIETKEVSFKIKKPGESEFSDQTINVPKPKEDESDEHTDTGSTEEGGEEEGGDETESGDSQEATEGDESLQEAAEVDDDSEEEEEAGGSEKEVGDEEESSSEEEYSEVGDSDKKEFNALEFSDGEFETEAELKSHIDFLKENPELKGMIEYYRENGTLLPYLQATQIDVDKFSDIEILQEAHKSENENLDLSPDEQLLLFNDEVLSKYPIDDEDESVAKIAKIRLKKAAAKYREELKAEQEALKLPMDRDVSKVTEALEAKSKEDAKEKEIQKNKLGFALRKQVKDGKLTVKINDETSVTLDVSSKKISQLLEKTSDQSLFVDKEGNFDLQTMAFLTDKALFIETLSNNFEADGKKKFIKKEMKNRPEKKKSPEGEGQGKKRVERLDPTKISSLKGAKIIRKPY